MSVSSLNAGATASSVDADANVLAVQRIAARMERLPPSHWHTRMRVLMGLAALIDSFDATTIAFVLPVLVGLWHLSVGQIGLLISSGVLGQVLGSATCGAIAERKGRVRVLRWNLLLLSVSGIACGCAPNFQTLLIFRVLQGLGIGGANPLVATYVNEIAPAKTRGRFVVTNQFAFPLGVMLASIGSVVIVPNLGWQWMFFIGAIPALFALPLGQVVPESPRWIAAQGRLDEAEKVMQHIEAAVSENGRNPLPPAKDVVHVDKPEKAHWQELFQGPYRRRTLTVWIVWICTLMIGYGLLQWMPSLFRTVYKLPVRDALMYTAIGNVAHLVAGVVGIITIDRYGRRRVYMVSFGLTAVVLLIMSSLGIQGMAIPVMILISIAGSVNVVPQLAMWVYCPEIYPTRMRSLATGVASSLARIASMLTPLFISFLLQEMSISVVYVVFSFVALVGAVTMFWAVEPNGRVLEEVSP